MFKALYSHVNNVIEKYLQIYFHILLYLQWEKKEKIKLKQVLNHLIHNDKKLKIKTNGIYTNLYINETTLAPCLFMWSLSLLLEGSVH